MFKCLQPRDDYGGRTGAGLISAKNYRSSWWHSLAESTYDGAVHFTAGDGPPYHVLYGWEERPGLPPASQHLGRGTGRPMPSAHPIGSLPSRRRRIRSLTVIKQDVRLWTIPMVVFNTSAQPHDIDVCYQLGVNSYMMKPMDFERLKYALELLMRYWFSVVTLPERRSL
jgi:hypothetical protein